jgi:hypothetical protein
VNIPWKFTDLHTAYFYQKSCIPMKRAYALGFIDGWMWENPRSDELHRSQEKFYEQGWIDGAEARNASQLVPSSESSLPTDSDRS